MHDLHKYPRTHHLAGSRLQPGDEDLSAVSFEVLGDRHVVIEEKIDGANAGISFTAEGELLLQSRGHYLTGGYRERHFSLFKTWAQTHRRALWEMLGSRYVMYGEWAYAKHTVFYDQLPHYFLEFDLLDKASKRFLSTRERDARLDRSVVVPVPVLFAGPTPRQAEVVGMIQRSLYKGPQWRDVLRRAGADLGQDSARVARETDPSDLMEGLYIKVETADAVIARYKYIRASFLTAVLDAEGHWLSRPILPNQLRPGRDIFSPELSPEAPDR